MIRKIHSKPEYGDGILLKTIPVNKRGLQSTQYENCNAYTWHVTETKVCDTVVVVQQHVQGVEGPSGLGQQPRSQSQHEPRH